MTELNLNTNATFNMWCHQNQAECADGRDGCLQDNFLMYCKRGIAIVYERYLNPWSSGHHVKFAKYDTPDELKLWNEWQAFCDEYDKEYGCDYE